MKAYSEDLRKRVIESHKEGKEKGEIIKIFKIGISTLNRWIREYEASGSYGPKRRTSYRKRKLNRVNKVCGGKSISNARPDG
jgi:transposase